MRVDCQLLWKLLRVIKSLQLINNIRMKNQQNIISWESENYLRKTCHHILCFLIIIKLKLELCFIIKKEKAVLISSTESCWTFKNEMSDNLHDFVITQFRCFRITCHFSEFIKHILFCDSLKYLNELSMYVQVMFCQKNICLTRRSCVMLSWSKMSCCALQSCVRH